MLWQVKIKPPIKNEYKIFNSIGFKIKWIIENIICWVIAQYLFWDMFLQEAEKQFHINERANSIVNQQDPETFSLGLKIIM